MNQLPAKVFSIIKKVFIYGTIFILNFGGSSECCEDCYPTEMQIEPIYMSYEELRTAVKADVPREIKNRGKILVSGNLFFANDKNLGVHIFDTSDPANPKPLAFIEIPGNLDISLKNNTLYADSYVDLVAIDVSNPGDPGSIKVTGRQEDVFPYDPYQSVDESSINSYDKDKGVIIGITGDLTWAD